MWPRNPICLDKSPSTSVEIAPPRLANAACIRKITFLLIFQFAAVLQFAPILRGAQGSRSLARVTGTVFLEDAAYGRSVVASAKVTLGGPAAFETETDEDGNFSLTEVPSGNYKVQARAPGLSISQNVRVQASDIHLLLRLKPTEVTSTVVVKADASEGKGPAPSETITANTLRDAPNTNERFESALPLIPGVVRGPDGHVNLKGGRNTQSGALVNSANVTDPVTGGPAINLPIDVVSSVQVISNPYDPQYGKFTGAVATIATKTSDYEKFHFSFQNFVPRLRDRDGIIAGIGAATPRITFTGPIVKRRIAITQSFEYRFVRTPVNSLPPLERDTKLESFDSYTQLDFILTPKQTATASFAVYPQKLDYLGLNTFNTQASTPDFHQRGFQVYLQHRYIIGTEGLLTSQFSYKKFDADITPQNDDPYRLLLETTQGGFFNKQARRSSRVSWDENYHFAHRQFAGSHQFMAGLSFEHSEYDGRQTFLPVEIDGISDTPIERILFSAPTSFAIDQNETSWFVGDQWTVSPRLTLTPGLRFDYDTITHSAHAAPRIGFLLTLTRDSKTLLKGGVGRFYDRVPLLAATFTDFPNRTVTILGENDIPSTSTLYENRLEGSLRNPCSLSWNLELDREVTQNLLLRFGYEQRHTTDDFLISPFANGTTGAIELSNGASSSYREFQWTARYKLRENIFNASYVRSRAFGDLNDLNQFFGNLAQPVIQPNGRGRLSFDAPNRFLFWATLAGPLKLTLVPVYELHTGFPYSVENEFREYVGPRNIYRFPRFSSFDLQVTRRIALPLGDHHLHARVGFGVFNLFNHFNPRDVQNIAASTRFDGLFNSAWREFRGKFVLEF
jgi:hypothetical protein